MTEARRAFGDVPVYVAPHPASEPKALTDARAQALEEACAAIKAADDKSCYMLDPNDCIRVIRALLAESGNATGEGRYDWTTTGMKQSPDGAWVMASTGEKK